MLQTSKAGLRLQQFCLRCSRSMNNQTTVTKFAPKIHSDPPQDIRRDWIGPADPKSNLRPVKFYIPPDETPLEREYREKRQEAQKWNMEFWAKHNENFKKEKEKYSKVKLKKLGRSENETLTTEDMYEFYRQFLDSNYRMHIYYNKEWYRRNISLLWPAFKVALQKMMSGRNR